jgi:hypothetical protein
MSLVLRHLSQKVQEVEAKTLIASLDDDYDLPISTEHQAALRKWLQYKQLVKTGRFFPRKYRKEGFVQTGGISFGVAKEWGGVSPTTNEYIYIACIVKQALFHFIEGFKCWSS